MSKPTPSLLATESDEQYREFELALLVRVAGLTAPPRPLFQTDATPEALWAAYLEGIPEHRRQHYNCHTCRRFIQRYGGLVTIDERGMITPALWSHVGVPSFFLDSIESLYQVAYRSKVSGVFLSSEPTWGTATAGGWSHLASPSPRVFGDAFFGVPVKTAAQAMAEKLEDFKILSHGLADYSQDVVNQAVRVLSADALDRSEKTLGIATWLAKLHESIKIHHRRENLIWRAVATAPPGFAHVRSTMIATLLDDIVAGLEFETIRGRWAQKMHPLQYQRPSAPPSAGSIDQAEKLVEQLGVARSLLRRYATLDDVLAKLWPLPSPPAPPPMPIVLTTVERVFDHLKPSNQPAGRGGELRLPPVTMTWEKFARTILPNALSIEIDVPVIGAFYGLVTAADPEAPPILQWDGLPDQPRNPVSWYFYHGGSTAARWNLTQVQGGWAKVNAVFLTPPHWQAPQKFAHQRMAIFFAIDGCHDTNSGNAGLALFPETLKSEFHGIRAVIEAHSRTAGITDVEAGNANGLAFQNRSPVTLRVRTPAEGLATYVIDRMD